MGHEMQHTFKICPEGFVVTESDISHALLERVRERYVTGSRRPART